MIGAVVVVHVPILSEVCVDLGKAYWVASVEKLGQCAVGAFVFALGCRRESSNGEHAFAGEPCFSRCEVSAVVGGKRVAVIRKDLLGFAVGGERFGKHGARISTVFR